MRSPLAGTERVWSEVLLMLPALSFKTKITGVFFSTVAFNIYSGAPGCLTSKGAAIIPCQRAYHCLASRTTPSRFAPAPGSQGGASEEAQLRGWRGWWKTLYSTSAGGACKIVFAGSIGRCYAMGPTVSVVISMSSCPEGFMTQLLQKATWATHREGC